MEKPTRSDLEAAAREFFAEFLREARARGPLEADWDERGFNVEMSSGRLSELEEQLRDNAFDRKVEFAARRLMVRAGLAEKAAPSPEAQQLAARVEREQMRFLLHNLSAPWKEFQLDDAVLAAEQYAAVQPGLVPAPEVAGPSVAETIRRFLMHKRNAGVGSSQLDEVARALSWLQEHLGPTKLLSTVTKDELRDFRDRVERLDKRLQGRGGIAFEGRQTGDRRFWNASATSIRHWRAAQALFAWATAEGFLDSDLSAGLKIARRKTDVNRTPEPFTPDELRTLFANSPLFAGHRSRRQLLAPGTCRERGSYFWSGLLGLYTGMRAGESAQLLTTDFDFDAEVPIIHVRAEDATGKASKKLKTPSSKRVVPIAAPLLQLGLREFVAGRHKIFKVGRLMRDVRLGLKDRTSDGLTKFWARALQDAGVHKPGRGTHVFRHTITAAMREASVPEELIGGVLGHAPATITGQYGGGFSPARLATAIRSVDYGFDVVDALGGPYQAALHRA